MQDYHGFKISINLIPIIYQDKVISFNHRPPRAVYTDKCLNYRDDIRDQIQEQVTGPFKCDVTMRCDFYLETKRRAYPTGYAHMLIKGLVPHLIADMRHILEVTSVVHYNDDNSKEWQPRTEITIVPLIQPDTPQ